MKILLIENDEIFGKTIKDFISLNFPDIEMDVFSRWTYAITKAMVDKTVYFAVIFDKGPLGITTPGAIKITQNKVKAPVILIGESFSEEERNVADFSFQNPFSLDILSKTIKDLLAK